MKRFSIILFSLLFSFTTYSQGVDLGIKFGTNYSTLTNFSNLNYKSGYQAGAFGAIKFSDKLAIQGDVLFSQQGQNSSFNIENFDLDYVNVAVVVKYYLVKGFNLQLGPQYGFLINENNFEGPTLESFDLSGVLGAGYDLPFGLRFDARYHFGFTDVLKESNSKNQVFSLALGYSFL